MVKTLSVLQSNYIPWKGFFDLINLSDHFIVYDDCQYTKNDWRNRNRIKTSQGLQWLSIPVRHRTSDQKINETETADNRWRKKHWLALQQSYSKTEYFDCYFDTFETLYVGSEESNLSKINVSFIETINSILGIETTIHDSREFELTGNPTEKLLNLCDSCKAGTYLSGPAASSYLDTDLAKQRGISIRWMDYSGYPEYPQRFPPFEHSVSILDLLFNTGPNARKFMNTL